MTDIPGLVERLRMAGYHRGPGPEMDALFNEAADALERMAEEYRQLDDSHTHFYVGFHNQAEKLTEAQATIACLEAELARLRPHVDDLEAAYTKHVATIARLEAEIEWLRDRDRVFTTKIVEQKDAIACLEAALRGEMTSASLQRAYDTGFKHGREDK